MHFRKRTGCIRTVRFCVLSLAGAAYAGITVFNGGAAHGNHTTPVPEKPLGIRRLVFAGGAAGGAGDSDRRTEHPGGDDAFRRCAGVDAASYGRDYLSISQTGQDYQIAKQAVAEASDIREDKVAELKTSVQSGKYDVDSGDFASMLLAKYNEMKK